MKKKDSKEKQQEIKDSKMFIALEKIIRPYAKDKKAVVAVITWSKNAISIRWLRRGAI